MIKSHFIFIVVFFIANIVGSCDKDDPAPYTVEDFYGIWKLDPEQETFMEYGMYQNGFILENDDHLGLLFIDNVTATPDKWEWKGPEVPAEQWETRYTLDLEAMKFTMYRFPDKSDNYPFPFNLEIISLDRIKLTNPITGEEDIFIRDDKL